MRIRKALELDRYEHTREFKIKDNNNDFTPCSFTKWYEIKIYIAYIVNGAILYCTDALNEQQKKKRIHVCVCERERENGFRFHI